MSHIKVNGVWIEPETVIAHKSGPIDVIIDQDGNEFPFTERFVNNPQIKPAKDPCDKIKVRA